MKTSKILFGIIVIVLIVVGVLVWKGNSSEYATNTPPPTTDETPSIKGCYVAHLSKDVYTLSIDAQAGENISGKIAYNNFEKDSSSGSFVGTLKDGTLLGDYSFSSEGMDSVRQVAFKKTSSGFVQGFGPTTTEGNKEVFSDLSKMTYDSNSNFVSSPNCIEHFVDANNTISFDYGSFFVANPGDNILTTDWKVNSSQKGILLASVSVPRTFMPKTNFSGVNFTVGRSSDATAIKNCAVKTQYDDTSEAGTMISGLPFTKFTSGDAGAGNLYDTTSYRGVVDGDCYAIEYTIHSTNIGNYDPSQGVTQFDKSAIQAQMEKIVKNFKFIINSD